MEWLSPGAAFGRLFCGLLLTVASVGEVFAAGAHLRWDANTEPNLAGYVVVYGTATGLYTQSIEVGPSVPEVDISDLSPGTTYYFAVRAFDIGGLQSSLSNEALLTMPPASLPAPTISGTSPGTGPTTGGTAVTITGTGFTTGATVRLGAVAATVQSVTATTIVAVAPAQGAGTVGITVTNPDVQSVTRASTFTYVSTAPSITSLSPASGPMTGGTLVTLGGTNFTAGATVRFGSTIASVQSLSATAIVVTAPALPAGAAPVSVVLTDGQTATAAGTFTSIAPTPVISAVGPAWGPTSGGTAVTISGSQFMSGASVLFGNTSAVVTSLLATIITVTSPAQAAGTVSVSVVNPGGSIATQSAAFTYQAVAPVLTAVSPARGPVTGGNTVVVSGQYFTAGATVSFAGVAGVVTSVSSTAIAVRVPGHPGGAVAVSVRNADGQTATVAGAYTYEALAPTVAGVSPDRGSVAGGTVLTITGEHFVTGAFVTIGGTPADVTGWSGNALQVRTPVGPAGPAAVRVRNPDGLETIVAAGFTYVSDETPPPTAFVRYFAEGVQGNFFETRFALANPHDTQATVEVTFTDPLGRETRMGLQVPAGGHATIDRTNMPALSSEAFATRFESDLEIGIDRTVLWDVAHGYGAHSETGILSPRTSWYFAEGATHSGFDVFYLLQNPTDRQADVLVRYMLGTGAIVEKVHYVAPFARTNIWVNHEDPLLRAAEVSAQLVSLNDVPIVAERSMYQSVGNQLFTAGHNSAGIAAPALRWFLAEGATGDFFDMFVLIANPGQTAAELEVTYLLPSDEPVRRTYTVAPSSRFTIWVDYEDPRLRATDVSVVVRSTNDVPVIVERTMWWPGEKGGRWTEAHNSAGATSTAPRWVLADGISSTTTGAVTYALVANTGTVASTVRFTLLTPEGRGRSMETTVPANSRFSVDVAQTFPEALNRRFGLLVESLDSAPLVVERASYWNADGLTWAAGTNSLAMPLSPTPDR